MHSDKAFIVNICNGQCKYAFRHFFPVLSAHMPWNNALFVLIYLETFPAQCVKVVIITNLGQRQKSA